MVRYLRAANVTDGQLALEDVKEMNFTPAEQQVFSLRSGDILVTEGSGSETAVGATAVWQGELEGTVCFQNTLLRLRPRSETTDPGYLAWWCRHAHADGLFASIATGANIFHLSAERVGTLQLSLPPMAIQRKTADFLDAECGRIDALVAHKRRLLALLEEKIDARINDAVGRSALTVHGQAHSTVLVHQILSKLDRLASGRGEMVTAFRDGQVTARSLRRSEGFTQAWTESAQVQGVCTGDVVVHGLDGFAGAIGVSETDGVCSPVYHVCRPRDGGDGAYLARMLRYLAVNGYLGLFASSTRERAVDFRNWDLFGRIPVPRVSAAEQREIGDQIRKLAPVRTRIEESIDLAQEYRRTLITAVISGELSVV
jgi:type I restriction enzyme S subunit